MKKYINLFLLYMKFSWMRVMEYRTNFIIWMALDAAWSIMDLLFFGTILANTETIGNWTLTETLIVIGIFRLMSVPVWGWFYQSFSEVIHLIEKAELDMLLTKPVESQFAVSVRKFSMSVLPSIIIGSVFVAIGLSQLPHMPSLLQFVGFAWLLFVSLLMIYGMYFASIATALFFDRFINIASLFPSLYDTARYPKEIYPLIGQRLLTTIIPFALMLIVPAEMLFGKRLC